MTRQLEPQKHRYIQRHARGQNGLSSPREPHEQKPGGVFVVEDDNGLLFAAVAETNLAYAMALGRLGKMISYARYSADIFAENMLDDDD